jgi:small nuclear ribonucleoprotein (snRNP)-like protein
MRNMELINYIGLKVKIILKNNYYYIGTVFDADADSIDLIDIKQKKVSINKDSIYSIQEVGE